MNLLKLFFNGLSSPKNSTPKDDVFDEEKYNAENQEEIDRVLLKYDFNSIEGICAIPVPKTKQPLTSSLPNVVVQLEYILQRKATEHKKNGRMDLAIACLQKSNQLMPYSCVSYSAKDYLRLVEYLEQDKQFEEARKEQELIERNHPELFNGTSNEERFWEAVSKANQGEGLITISSSRLCPQCSLYNGRTYSTGKDRRFPNIKELPPFMRASQCSRCGCCIGANPAFPSLGGSQEIQKQIQFSSRPIQDYRTAEEKVLFEQEDKERQFKIVSKREFDWLQEHHPDICPKSLAGFSRMKKSNSVNYQTICKSTNNFTI